MAEATMDVNAIKLIYFSPTRTTKRVLEGIAAGIPSGAVEHLDLTPPAAHTQEFAPLHDELAIVGAPVYGGLIPIDAVHRLRRLRGNDTPAVVVAVYGNREYEDALLELRELVTAGGFRPVAGGAFIGEHSFSNAVTPIAVGRPDAQDLQKAMAFGRMIRDKLRGVQALDEVAPVAVPGNLPLKERDGPWRMPPVTKAGVCTLCGECATVCPTAAIAMDGVVVTDGTACISCCACVKICPTGARVMEDARARRTARWLNAEHSERKEPEVYV
jgi:ferredoxin